MEKRIVWHLEKKKLTDLKPYDKNPRIITEFGLKQLGESFDEIGFAQPLNINIDGTILSGHARYMKLSEEGVTEIECMVPDRVLTPKQEEAVIIRMNKNVAGKWDFDKLANEFEYEDLRNWGFEDYEMPTPDINPDDFFIDKPEDKDKDSEHTIKIELTAEDHEKAMAYLKAKKISAEEAFMRQVEQG